MYNIKTHSYVQVNENKGLVTIYLIISLYFVRTKMCE